MAEREAELIALQSAMKTMLVFGVALLSICDENKLTVLSVRGIS